MSYRFNPFTGSFDLVTNPAGASGDVQLNINGGFGVATGFKWVTGELQVPGDLKLVGTGSHTTTLQLVTPTAARTITFPDATGTVALVGGTTGQILYNLDGAVAGTGVTFDATTGTRFTLPFGYGPGAGGTVTQASNKSTGVTLNTRNGRITLNAAELAANTTVSFTLTNSQISENDHLQLGHPSGGTLGSYHLAYRCANGSATIAVRNITAAALSEAMVISFAVFKGSIT